MRVGPTLDRLLKEYPDDVRIVYKQHPLSMHRQAPLAAQAVLAAHAQGKYFEMHEKLFQNIRTLSRQKMIQVAGEIGLDIDRFQKDLDSQEIKAIVARETREAVAVGATGTPASFINGRYLSGAQPYKAFKTLVDEELKWAAEGNRPEFTIGKNVSEVRAKSTARRRGPDPAKVYNIPPGAAAFAGPKNAKVTILHYLDYQ
ncbi:MAG: DsbA family protein [Acidobacteria bacterium]|nr:DsbA family protein [Acidobacteriota bacterium]